MANEIMTGDVQLDALRPELWSANFYPTLLEGLPFNSSVSQEYEGEISALGDILNISKFPQFDDAQEINESEAADSDSVTVTNMQLVINKQVTKDYIITKRALKQTINAQDQLGDLANFALMKKMQDIIIAETVPSASLPDHQIPYDSGTLLALADILEAKELLDNALVPDDGKRTMILDAEQWNDLFVISGFTSRDFIPAGSPMTTGTFATPIMGFMPKMTTRVNSVSYFFHSDYLTLAVQQLPSVEVVSLGGEGKRALRVNMDVLFGVKQLGNTRVVSIS